MNISRRKYSDVSDLRSKRIKHNVDKKQLGFSKSECWNQMSCAERKAFLQLSWPSTGCVAIASPRLFWPPISGASPLRYWYRYLCLMRFHIAHDSSIHELAFGKVISIRQNHTRCYLKVTNNLDTPETIFNHLFYIDPTRSSTTQGPSDMATPWKPMWKSLEHGGRHNSKLILEILNILFVEMSNLYYGEWRFKTLLRVLYAMTSLKK